MSAGGEMAWSFMSLPPRSLPSSAGGTAQRVSLTLPGGERAVACRVAPRRRLLPRLRRLGGCLFHEVAAGEKFVVHRHCRCCNDKRHRERRGGEKLNHGRLPA